MTLSLLDRLPLGAPGIYEMRDEPVRALTGVRMDVCAFVGVAPRGPARVPAYRVAWSGERPSLAALGPVTLAAPVAVESWSEYQRLFGDFEGPGRLPYAVAAFFENGGRRAYVLRIVHRYGDARDAAGIARSAAMPGVTTRGGAPIGLRARDEGSWGNGLAATLSFVARPLAVEPSAFTLLDVTLDPSVELPAGSLLRLTHAGDVRTLAFVCAVRDEWRPDEGRQVRRATFDLPLGALPLAVEIVEGELEVRDGTGRIERLERLGLAAEHPRWAAAVLIDESSLVFPDDVPATSWIAGELLPTTALTPAVATPFAGPTSPVQDRFADIVPDDFFDDAWTPGDEEPGAGVQSLAELTDLSLLCAPDLYQAMPLVGTDDVRDPLSLAGAEFDACVDVAAPPPLVVTTGDLDGLQLDPRLPDDLREIGRLQRALVAFAEQVRGFVTLLDVPPGLSQRAVLDWRAQFASSFAAAYHPWLRVARLDDRRDALVRINPSGVAAGLIAQRERTDGIPHGPANVLAAGVVDVEERVPPARHDALHPAGINVFLIERDGVRLSAARTLSRDPQLRQLSVRRLMTMLRRVLEQQMQWMVFEPNDAGLRGDVRQLLREYLRQLYEAGAFRGAREEDAFFVTCDDALNPTRVLDAGQLICEVGVAPTEPLEFLVLHLSRDGDGTILVED